MKKTIVIPQEIVQEDQILRRLVADRSKIMHHFPPAMEHMFWQALAERSIRMIRQVMLAGTLLYLVVGLVTFPTVYALASDSNRLHDIMIWLLVYLNGAACLVALPIMASIPGMSVHFKRIVIAITFMGVFVTSFLMVQYATPRLVQQAGYIIVLVYMLVYFLTGIPPITVLITCLIAGLLPLPLFWAFKIHFDPVLYFYAVIFSNVVGFIVSYTVTAKERYSYLQSRLLELDKIHSAIMSDELTRLSNEDALTGLYNRRYFNEAINHEWERAERSSEPLTVIFVDIDYFKAYNDTYGHQQGDSALIQVAHVLHEHMRRSSDLASRYGGEEFILLLPNTPSIGAHVVAQSISQAVDDLNIEHRASKVARHLTLSIGIATWNNERDMDVNKLIAQADEAVYEAKAKGRHTICVYEAK